MHELFLIKVPETLDTKAFMHPVTIMTRSPPVAWYNKPIVSLLRLISSKLARASS